MEIGITAERNNNLFEAGYFFHRFAVSKGRSCTLRPTKMNHIDGLLGNIEGLRHTVLGAGLQRCQLAVYVSDYFR